MDHGCAEMTCPKAPRRTFSICHFDSGPGETDLETKLAESFSPVISSICGHIRVCSLARLKLALKLQSRHKYWLVFPRASRDPKLAADSRAAIAERRLRWQRVKKSSVSTWAQPTPSWRSWKAVKSRSSPTRKATA